MEKYYLSESEGKELLKLQQRFIKSYTKYKDSMSLNEWLNLEIGNNLPHKSKDEIDNISKNIIHTIDINEENKKSLKDAIKDGRSKESWFASKLKESLSYMNIKDFGQYLQELDDVIAKCNEDMIKTITNKSGEVSKNKNLDGFIAEQHHVNSFNMNAKIKGSEYRAEVIVPKEGEVYSKNSVDIVIKDGSGKIVRKYQSKYCKDSDATTKAFEHGDYRGQRKLIPDGQNVDKGVSSIASPDGKIKSVPKTKEEAKNLQKEAQSGKYKEIDWNSYNTKDLAIGVGKQAGKAALYGAAIGTGFYIADKVMQGEDIEVEEVIDVAITTGFDVGIKAAVAGSIKVGVEKELIKCIPKGTPVGTIANIVYVGVENVKIAKKVFDGELTLDEGINEMEVTTVSMVCGIAAAAKGATIGGTIGSVLGPVGTAVGGFIGGTIGYMAGSEVGRAVTKETQEIREIARDTVDNITKCVKEGASRVASSVSNNVKSLLTF